MVKRVKGIYIISMLVLYGQVSKPARTDKNRKPISSVSRIWVFLLLFKHQEFILFVRSVYVVNCLMKK